MRIPLEDVRREPTGFALLLDYGFRPFFLLAGLWGAFGVISWLVVLAGAVTPPLALAPIDWHAHEMLFGFVGAALGGFLLTAVPNWTGRPRVRGPLLGILVGLWIAGRLAVGLGGGLPFGVVAAIDLAYLAALAAITGREVAASGNRRNFVVVALLAGLLTANLLTHLPATAVPGRTLGLHLVALLLALIGGRIVPNFTGNWLRRQGVEQATRPFGLIDRSALGLTLAAGLTDALWTGGPVAAVLLLAAGLAHLARLTGWLGWKAGDEPIVWVLHVGYGWLGVAYLLLGLSGLVEAVPRTAALHALTAGAFGTMILAVMTRASLGHTGRDIKAAGLTVAAYGAVIAGGLLRVVSAWVPAALHASGGLWSLGFLLFLVVYLPILVRPRV